VSPDRDSQMARLSLTLDPKERENLLAEHQKWERRRDAMQYGDTGSLIDPRSYDPAMPFTALPCLGCGVKLTSQNHSSSQFCHECVAHEERIAQNVRGAVQFAEKQRAYWAAKKEAEAKKAAMVVIAWVALWLAVATGCAMLGAYLMDKGFWWLGQVWP
jgi:hypothetical protein